MINFKSKQSKFKNSMFILIFIVLAIFYSNCQVDGTVNNEHLPLKTAHGTAQKVLNPQTEYKKQFQIQKQQYQNQIDQENKDLPTYIKQQIQSMNTINELPIIQIFSFIMRADDQMEFKWNPSKQKQLKLIVDVFEIDESGDYTAIRNAEEQEFVQVMARNPNKSTYSEVGKVYREKLFTVDFNTDYKYLKFINHNSKTILIETSIEQLEYVVQSGVPDDKLSVSRNKMHTILLQSQTTQVKRQHIYKWQWGFYQNEKQHQLQILGFTGIQLFTILITSFIQLYLLKGLVDNRAVV